MTATSDQTGDFRISNVAPGSYKVFVEYVGFSPFQTEVAVAAGATEHVDAKIEVASQAESIIVTAERVHGETEAI
jgi:Carboxypeptidase regulatory-like domain